MSYKTKGQLTNGVAKRLKKAQQVCSILWWMRIASPRRIGILLLIEVHQMVSEMRDRIKTHPVYINAYIRGSVSINCYLHYCHRPTIQAIHLDSLRKSFNHFRAIGFGRHCLAIPVATTPASYYGAYIPVKRQVFWQKINIPMDRTIFVGWPLLRTQETRFLKTSWAPSSQLMPASPLGVANAMRYVEKAECHENLTQTKEKNIELGKVNFVRRAGIRRPRRVISGSDRLRRPLWLISSDCFGY